MLSDVDGLVQSSSRVCFHYEPVEVFFHQGRNGFGKVSNHPDLETVYGAEQLESCVVKDRISVKQQKSGFSNGYRHCGGLIQQDSC